jgi:hypothetical protein
VGLAKLADVKPRDAGWIRSLAERMSAIGELSFSSRRDLTGSRFASSRFAFKAAANRR